MEGGGEGGRRERGGIARGCNRWQLSKTVVDCLPACLLARSPSLSPRPHQYPALSSEIYRPPASKLHAPDSFFPIFPHGVDEFPRKWAIVLAEQ